MEERASHVMQFRKFSLLQVSDVATESRSDVTAGVHAAFMSFPTMRAWN